MRGTTVRKKTYLNLIHLCRVIFKVLKAMTLTISIIRDTTPCLLYTLTDTSEEVAASICKVKESRNGPGVAQRVPGVLGSQISMTFST